MLSRVVILAALLVSFAFSHLTYARLLSTILLKSSRVDNAKSSTSSLVKKNSSGNSTMPHAHSRLRRKHSKTVLSYLSRTYKVKKRPTGPQEFYIRQVPGDGACLFNALASCIVYKISQKHFAFEKNMEKVSAYLRELAVKVLSSDNTSFHMEKGEYINSSELLAMTAEHYNITKEKYCLQMLKKSTWGGGPEIVALCNYMKRPIHVYELCLGSNKTERALS